MLGTRGTFDCLNFALPAPSPGALALASLASRIFVTLEHNLRIKFII